MLEGPGAPDQAATQGLYLPFTFEAQGWEDANGDRHSGKPTDLDDTLGVFVHAYDPENPEDSHYFWAWIPSPGFLDEWDAWEGYIESLMDMCGMEL